MPTARRLLGWVTPDLHCVPVGPHRKPRLEASGLQQDGTEQANLPGLPWRIKRCVKALWKLSSTVENAGCITRASHPWSGYLGVNSLGRRSLLSLPLSLSPPPPSFQASDTQAGLEQVERWRPPPVQNRAPSFRTDSWGLGTQPKAISALGPGAGEGRGRGLLPGPGGVADRGVPE